MKNYMDRTWAAVDHTILAYSGADEVLKIPERLAGMRVSVIGNGVFMESDKTRQVIVPRSVSRIGMHAFFKNKNLVHVFLPGTVSEIGDQAFGSCEKLANITVYDTEIPEQYYNELKASCRKTDGNLYVAHSFPEIRVLKKVLNTVWCKAAVLVPDGIERLFVSHNLTEDTGRNSLLRPLERIEFAGFAGSLTEENAFLSFIGTGEGFPADKETELRNDAFVRLEKYPPIEKTAVFTFDDSRTRAEGDKRFITVNINIGYHFWQSGAAVKYRGKDYLVYQRQYLSPVSEFRYLRRDAAVFSEKGLVNDRREAQEVYAKYKLLSIL